MGLPIGTDNVGTKTKLIEEYMILVTSRCELPAQRLSVLWQEDTGESGMTHSPFESQCSIQRWQGTNVLQAGAKPKQENLSSSLLPFLQAFLSPHFCLPWHSCWIHWLSEADEIIESIFMCPGLSLDQAMDIVTCHFSYVPLCLWLSQKEIFSASRDFS